MGHGSHNGQDKKRKRKDWKDRGNKRPPKDKPVNRGK